jgi:hypothetical protein
MPLQLPCSLDASSPAPRRISSRLSRSRALLWPLRQRRHCSLQHLFLPARAPLSGTYRARATPARPNNRAEPARSARRAAAASVCSPSASAAPPARACPGPSRRPAPGPTCAARHRSGSHTPQPPAAACPRARLACLRLPAPRASPALRQPLAEPHAPARLRSAARPARLRELAPRAHPSALYQWKEERGRGKEDLLELLPVG